MKLTTQRWVPWQELDQLRDEMDRFMRDPGAVVRRTLGADELPRLNLWAGETEAVVSVEVPGASHESLDVSIEDNLLTIRGSWLPVEVAEGQQLLRHERPEGKFSRTVQLPFEVDNQRTNAVYDNGVLTVRLYRTGESAPRKIEIRRV